VSEVSITANAAGEEFGIQRLQAEFQKHGNKPLADVHTALVASIRQHGTQFDDQSLLLIRRLAS